MPYVQIGDTLSWAPEKWQMERKGRRHDVFCPGLSVHPEIVRDRSPLSTDHEDICNDDGGARKRLVVHGRMLHAASALCIQGYLRRHSANRISIGRTIDAASRQSLTSTIPLRGDGLYTAHTTPQSRADLKRRADLAFVPHQEKHTKTALLDDGKCIQLDGAARVRTFITRRDSPGLDRGASDHPPSITRRSRRERGRSKQDLDNGSSPRSISTRTRSPTLGKRPAIPFVHHFR